MSTATIAQRRPGSVALLALLAFSLGCLSVAPAIPTGNSTSKVSLGGGSSSQVTASSPNACEIDVDFGTVPIGEALTAMVNVANVGTSYLDLSTVDPTLDPEFSVKFGPQDTVYPGDAGGLSVTFEPYKTGQVAGSFTIQTDANNASCPNPSELTVALSGNGIQLSLAVQPDVLDFGNVLINTSARKSVTLVNKSSAPVDGLTTTLTGSDANLFQVLDAPTTLAANAQATVDITYAPLALETRSTATVVFSGSDGETAALNLFGEPVSVALTFSPNPCDFGYVPLNSTVVCCSTVTNQANVDVTIKSVINFATAGNAFALATTDDSTPPNPVALPITINGGAAGKVCFTFTPPITQQYQGQATLVSDDPSGTNPIVKLTGWGGGPQISCTPTTLGFGEGLDHSPASAVVVCTNTGTAVPGMNLILDPPTATPADFTASFDANEDPYPAGGLEPGQSVQIDVTFTPAEASDETGTLFIKSNGGNGNPLQIPLSGTSLQAGDGG